MIAIKLYLAWGELMVLATLYIPEGVKHYQTQLEDGVRKGFTRRVMYWNYVAALATFTVGWPVYMASAIKSKRG